MNPFIAKQLEKVGATLDRWMERRDLDYVLPEHVQCIEDHGTAGEDYRRMDIYYPDRKEGERLPVIVDIHGGGMVLCDRKANRPFCAELAKRGFLVFALDYPLVPKADIPRILRETAARMEEVKKLIDGLGGDPERIYLVGDSAGAFISVYELAAQKNPDIARILELTPTTLDVKAAAFISGMFYTTRTDSNCMFLRADFYGKNWRSHPFRPSLDPAVPAVAGAMPPCWLVTAKMDSLRSYTLDFVKGLRKAGIRHTLLDLPRDKALNHDFPIVRPEHPQSQQVIDELCAFLKQY